MTTCPTIERFKQEISKFEPSSDVYTVVKSNFNGRVALSRLHGVRYTHEVNSYSLMLRSQIAESFEKGKKPEIDVELTLKRLYSHVLFTIAMVAKFKMTKKNLEKHREILKWINKKENLFAFGYEWREDPMIDSILKVGLWLNQKSSTIELRDQTLEVIKLLMIKEQKNG